MQRRINSDGLASGLQEFEKYASIRQWIYEIEEGINHTALTSYFV